MNQNKQKVIAGIILAVFIGIALYLRIVPTWEHVFAKDGIRLTGIDAYRFMRLVDNLVYNFPHLISFDPYMDYPHGAEVGSLNLFVYILAGIAWLIGLGAPTQHTADIVAVYFPPIVSALAIIPVYFIGKALFNRWVGLMAAGLTAIFPGEILGRTILGHTDKDALELLLTGLTMLFLILAINTAKQNRLTFQSMRHWNRSTMLKPLLYSFLAAIFLGIYLHTWMGAFIFVFIILVYLIIQGIIEHITHNSTDYLAIVGTITFFIATLMFLPASPTWLYSMVLIIALVIPCIMSTISRLMADKTKPAYYPMVIFGTGIAVVAIIYIITPATLRLAWGLFGNIFGITGPETTVFETEPFLFPAGHFLLFSRDSTAWLNFTTSFYIGIIPLVMLILAVIKRNKPEIMLFLVWTLVILIATLAMRRIALLFAINLALLSGYLAWRLFQLAGLRETTGAPAQAQQKPKAKAKKKKSQQKFNSGKWLNVGIAVMIAFFVLFFPNFGPATVTAGKTALYGPDDGWSEALSWLEDNTPDPFDTTDFYYQKYQPPPNGQPFKYPKTTYAVASWWDYGYWIIRTSHRLPNCHPGGNLNREKMGLFLTAQSEAAADPILGQMNAKYIVIDRDTALSKFYAIAAYAGHKEQAFYEDYFQPQGGKLRQIWFFYPEYFRAISTRLYNFGGAGIMPTGATVISYEQKIDQDGNLYREITSMRTFADDKEAEAYMAMQKSGNWRLGSTNPFFSPVRLEHCQDYKLVYSSSSLVSETGVGKIPAVKIFEHQATKPASPNLASPSNGSVQSGSTITFTWSSAPRATDYNIVIWNSSKVFFDSWVGNVTTYKVANFPNDGTEFYWLVYPRNSAGIGPQSSTGSFINGTK